MIDMRSRDAKSIKIAEEFIGYTAYNTDGELFRVIDYEFIYEPKYNRRHMYYVVQFAETGYEDIYRKQLILKHGCRDPYYPVIYGVACLGQASTIDAPFKYSREYPLWHSMIQRCYDANYKSYKTYGALGIKVCDRWLCYEFFLKDLPYIPGYTEWVNSPKGTYQFDKDMKQQGLPSNMKVYSPDTCIFILRQLNGIESTNRQYADKELPTGIQLSRAGNFMALYGKYNLGTYTNLDAAISQRNDYIRNTATIPNELIQPCTEMGINERRKYKVIYPKIMCRIVGDDRSEEFMNNITKQMEEN